MTLKTNSRIAGFAYLFYIAVAFPKPGVDVRVQKLFDFLSCVCALVLAVTLYAITRDEDRDLALLGFLFRGGEGISTAAAMIAKSSAFLIGGSLFAIGSTVFCYLLFRGRIIPRWLAMLGLTGSALVAIVLPAQLSGFVATDALRSVWYPIGIFEVIVAFWLIIKGAAPPTPAHETE